MTIITVQWKLEVLQEAKIAVSKHFKWLEKIEWVMYQGNGYPQFLYELLIWAECKVKIQWDIERLSEKLKVKPIRIKRMLKDYTVKELDTAYIKQWKIVVRNVIKVSKDF